MTLSPDPDLHNYSSHSSVSFSPHPGGYPLASNRQCVGKASCVIWRRPRSLYSQCSAPPCPNIATQASFNPTVSCNAPPLPVNQPASGTLVACNRKFPRKPAPAALRSAMCRALVPLGSYAVPRCSGYGKSPHHLDDDEGSRPVYELAVCQALQLTSSRRGEADCESRLPRRPCGSAR